ncbi:MAG TPA: hypothetical protein HA309_03315 [Candidatus Thalassarchaeaceae archaeon]|nr:hypothetical protein [Candidatus Thalassarchaeaceae archaeon]
MSNLRRAWSGIGILTLLFVVLLILQMVSPYLGWNDPDVEDGFVIDEVVSGLGGPACLEWVSDRDLLVCDRDGDVIRLLNFDMSEDEWKPTELSFTLLTNVHEPHDILILDDYILVSERGKLTRINQTTLDSTLDDAPRWTLIDGIPTGNHQTNNLDIMPNGTVIWHVGSTCNICDEADERNAALLWVNSSTGEHGILAGGVRNSFHGIWVPDMGYIFSDNGRDWEGDHPPEEVNLLIPGENYGWPDDDPDHPVPAGTIGPIATWTPHSSLNNLAYRPLNSSFPGGNHTVYATVFGSWNAIVPVGHEIVRIDFTENASEPQGWSSETSVFASDLSGPLPIVFHPSGDFLFYTNFLDDGTLYVISTG